MIDATHLNALLALAAIMVSGVFLTFSDFVMQALVRAPGVAGATAMWELNRTVFRSVFIALLIGLAPVTMVVAGVPWIVGTGVDPWAMTGAVIYLFGVLFVTMFGNVPLNEQLDNLGPDQAVNDGFWDRYGRVWTRWNHVRTLASLATGICFGLAALSQM